MVNQPLKCLPNNSYPNQVFSFNGTTWGSWKFAAFRLQQVRLDTEKTHGTPSSSNPHLFWQNLKVQNFSGVFPKSQAVPCGENSGLTFHRSTRSTNLSGVESPPVLRIQGSHSCDSAPGGWREIDVFLPRKHGWAEFAMIWGRNLLLEPEKPRKRWF